MEFDWDEHNISHIARHDVTQDEVEDAFTHEIIFVKEEVRHNEIRRSYLGQTTSGRILFLTMTERLHRTRCVTAFPANRTFRRAYLIKTGERHDEQA